MLQFIVLYALNGKVAERWWCSVEQTKHDFSCNPSKFIRTFAHAMIPAKTIQEIHDATRIEEVIEEFVALRKRGVNLIGLCPFHGEKTPSFNVNPPKNVFKCFGCGKAGDAIAFLREHENMTYVEALRWLARKYNIVIEEIEMTPEQVLEQQQNESLYIVNDFALKHFQDNLFQTDEGKSVALSYFRNRGLREDTILKFGLGYAPDAPKDALIQKAKSSGYSIDLIKKLGLSNQAGDRDFFRARVMFPIHNMSGKVSAFAGRTMSSEKTVPKYINSPETDIYVKNKILYGAFQAKKAIRQKDECILTEGYMDVISLSQAGIENVVASSGTSLTEGQLLLIKRNTSNLKILYDGDPAGIKAALRGLDLALEQDLNVKICLLPKDEDPDSYVQKMGTQAFLDYMAAHSKDFILFKTELLLDETKGDPIKKSGLVKDIVSSVAKIPDPIKRSVYLKECAALMEVPEDILVSETNKIITTGLKKRADKNARSGGAASDSPIPNYTYDPNFPMEEPPFMEQVFPMPEKSVKKNDEIQERDIARLLIQFGSKPMPNESVSVAEFILADIEDSLGSFENAQYGKVAQMCYQMVLDGQAFDQDFFFKHEDPTISALSIELLFERDTMSHNWVDRWNYPLQNQPMPEHNFDADTRQALDRFKLQKLDKMLDLNKARIKAIDTASNFEEAMRLMMVQQKMLEVRNTLARKAGTVVFK